MGLFSRALLRTTAVGTLAGLVTVSGMVFGPLSQSAQGDRLTATTGVNLRSGPGLEHSVVGGLWAGQQITASGDAVDGWTPVDLNGSRVYVASRYVTGDTTYGRTPATTSTAGTAVTTVNLNVRSGPATSYPVVTTLGRGTTVTLTGKTSGSWSEISRDGRNYWVSSVYLTTTTSTSTPTPSTQTTTPKPAPAAAAAGSATTTTNLNVRSGPSTAHTIITTLPRGTQVPTTGVVQDGWTQITWNGAPYWVASSYLSVASGTAVTQPAPTPVTAKATMYATTSVNVRTEPSTTARVVTTLERGQQVGVTGNTSNGWTEVVWQGAVRWVSGDYLSATAPAVSTVVVPVSTNSKITSSALSGSVGLATAVPSIVSIINTTERQWPGAGPYYVTRYEPGSDHHTGRAVDVMLSKWSTTDKAVGDAIAAHFQANASSYDVKYIIWRQRIWSVERSAEGWRAMADRGSNTANHYDHVHVSVN